MSKPQSKAQNSALLYLPACTLILVISLWSLQAISSPSMRPTQTHHIKQQASGPRRLPVLGQVQNFQLTERSEAQVQGQDLRGQVWVADFIFTSCQAECPLMNLEMQKIQEAFIQEPRFKMLSFSVDPAVDTAQRLREYAQHFNAGERWLFLTGERQDLHQLAKDSFKLPVVDLRAKVKHDHHAQDASAAGHAHPSQSPKHTGHDEQAHQKASNEKADSSPFLHSQSFVLVDKQLQIRGYYDSTSPEEMLQLIETDIPALLKE